MQHRCVINTSVPTDGSSGPVEDIAMDAMGNLDYTHYDTCSVYKAIRLFLV